MRNAIRRNRNIGTSKQGHGRANQMAIPLVSHGEYACWERIPGARQVYRIVSDRTIKFFVQPTRSDCVYAYTVDDVARLLSCLPTADWEGIDAIVLRQPSRK